MKLKNVWGDIFKTKKEISNESLLEKVILFNDLNVFEIQRLLPFLHVRQFQKNEIIFQKDEPGESLYIIKSGSVAIYESLSDEKITLKPTSFFGELSLVDENPRVVSATATKNAELLVLFRSDLLKIKQEHPKMAVKIIYNLSYILGKRLSTIYSDHNTKK